MENNITGCPRHWEQCHFSCWNAGWSIRPVFRGYAVGKYWPLNVRFLPKVPGNQVPLRKRQLTRPPLTLSPAGALGLEQPVFWEVSPFFCQSRKLAFSWDPDSPAAPLGFSLSPHALVPDSHPISWLEPSHLLAPPSVGRWRLTTAPLWELPYVPGSQSAVPGLAALASPAHSLKMRNLRPLWAVTRGGPWGPPLYWPSCTRIPALGSASREPDLKPWDFHLLAKPLPLEVRAIHRAIFSLTLVRDNGHIKLAGPGGRLSGNPLIVSLPTDFTCRSFVPLALPWGIADAQSFSDHLWLTGRSHWGRGERWYEKVPSIFTSLSIQSLLSPVLGLIWGSAAGRHRGDKRSFLVL